jgi:hypothetical protein
MKRLIVCVVLLLAGHANAQVNVDTSPLLLGVLKGANLNTTADQPITIVSASKYQVTQILVTNASGTPSLAVGGFYTAASKGGTALVAATQVYSALTAASKFVNVTMLAILTTDVRTESTLYFSLTTAQGSAMTADIYVFGNPLP